jgi:hypothetical protein
MTTRKFKKTRNALLFVTCMLGSLALTNPAKAIELGDITPNEDADAVCNCFVGNVYRQYDQAGNVCYQMRCISATDFSAKYRIPLCITTPSGHNGMWDVEIDRTAECQLPAT